jgi:hypothetical protein
VAALPRLCSPGVAGPEQLPGDLHLPTWWHHRAQPGLANGPRGPPVHDRVTLSGGGADLAACGPAQLPSLPKRIAAGMLAPVPGRGAAVVLAPVPGRGAAVVSASLLPSVGC